MTRSSVRMAALAVAFQIFVHTAAAQTPLGTAFSYQGRLDDGGSPASGPYDVHFRLFDASAGGAQLGPIICYNNLSVAEGLFTAMLDFGDQFSGQERFLEIAVRVDAGQNCANTSGFTTLLPRQKLNATPNALFAESADRLDGLDSSAFLQSIPIPLTLTGTSATHIIRGNNSSNSNQTIGIFGQTTGTGGGFGIQGQQRGGAGVVPTAGAGVFGSSDSGVGLAGFSNAGDAMFAITLGASGVTHGLTAESRSTSGIGVRGAATAATGTTYGLWGQSASTGGRGVFGLASAASGTTYGVYGQSDSSAGFAGYFLGMGSDALYVRNDGAGRGIQVLAANDTALWASTTVGIAGVDGRNASATGRGVYGYATAISGANYGVFGRTSSTEGRGVYGVATASVGSTAYGGYFESQGVDGCGVFGRATDTGGFNFGGRFESYGSQGYGVFGWARAAGGITSGVEGQSSSTSGRGVYGRASAISGTTYGGRFESASPSGYGVFGKATAGVAGSAEGGRFESASIGGIGVVGYATASSGDTYGGYFQSDSIGGQGVLGYARSSGDGSTYGVYGQSDSRSGKGVYGVATATSGLGNTYGGRFEAASPNGRGVHGWASATTGAIYGVYGQAADTSAGGYAVYAAGDMGGSGAKSFRIDHPSDPENKYLLHYSAESPEVINFYRGTAMLDERGEAIVELPAYFASINKDPSYQLTAVGAPMPMLHVAEEISEEALKAGEQARPGVAPATCRFRIAGGVAGAKVSWEVKAVRNDLRMRLHGAPVEREKVGPERGKYQQPEYYGQPPEMGMDYHEEREVSPTARSDTASR